MARGRLLTIQPTALIRRPVLCRGPGARESGRTCLLLPGPPCPGPLNCGARLPSYTPCPIDLCFKYCPPPPRRAHCRLTTEGHWVWVQSCPERLHGPQIGDVPTVAAAISDRVMQAEAIAGPCGAPTLRWHRVLAMCAHRHCSCQQWGQGLCGELC